MKKKYKEMIEQGENLSILLLIVILIYIVMQFFLAYHNLDLSFNLIRVTDSINSAGFYNSNGTLIKVDFSSLMDRGSDYLEHPLINYYISSMNNISTYFILGIVCSLALGILLSRRLK